MVYLNSQKLAELMITVLREKGVNEDSIYHVVTSLMQTSLRGVDSHGINLYPHYCRAIDSGRISKSPSINTEKMAPSSAIVDADHAFGHHAGVLAIDYAIKLAQKTGIAAVGVKNSTHFGAAAYFALRAAENNCIGFAFTNADALVKVYGSRDTFFGTNPICCCAPMKNEEPYCLDMATSLVSWNKIKNYHRLNKKIPAHWAFDANGHSVTDPHSAKSLAPIGDYKGYGLGMMVDILCALLVNGLNSKDILPMYDAPIEAKRYISHFFMAIDISKFVDIEFFKQNLQNMADRLRQLPLADDAEDVLVAGDPEKKTFQIRIKEGIPMDEEKFEEYLNISKAFEQALVV